MALQLLPLSLSPFIRSAVGPTQSHHFLSLLPIYIKIVVFLAALFGLPVSRYGGVFPHELRLVQDREAEGESV